jgi:hypothetical protein
MDQLPQELFDKICGYLPRDDLKNVLILTTKFRYAAERHSGAFSSFTINEDNAETFLERYSGHRLLYLREIMFQPTLAPLVYPFSYYEHCRENMQKLREKDEQFSDQIWTLFNLLRAVEDQAGGKHAPGRYRLAIYHPIRIVHLSHECQHHLFVSWRVHLLRVAQLPLIPSVRTLVVYDNAEGRRGTEGEWPRLDRRVSIDLATRFPNLEFLDVRTGGYEWCPKMAEEEPAKHYEHDWEGPRSDSRRDFATAVTSCITHLPSSLKKASLDFLNPFERATNIDHYMALPNLVSPLQKDPFSASLRLMSTNLRQLRIRAMVDETLFWPGDDKVSFGPNLEILEVMFHPARPDGKWYFQGPGGEGHDAIGYQITSTCYPPLERTHTDIDMDAMYNEKDSGCESHACCQFRISPIDTHLRPFLEGFAKAAMQMRFLKRALLWSPMRWYGEEYCEDIYLSYDLEEDDKMAWGITYRAPGQDWIPNSCRQLEWTVAQWRPDPQLHNTFQQIGRNEHGDILEESWTEDLAGPYHIYRERFLHSMFRDDVGRTIDSY